jgi:hypothetical protein
LIAKSIAMFKLLGGIVLSGRRILGFLNAGEEAKMENNG